MRKAEIYFGGDEEYRRLWNIRDRYGVTWRGMLIEGAKFLEEQDLIGKNAPSYLECEEIGQQSRPPCPEPEHAGSLVKRVSVTDHDIDFIQIEIVESDGEPDTEAEPAPDTDPDAGPDDESDAIDETDSPSSNPDPEPADGENPTTAGHEEKEPRDTTARPSKPVQDGTGIETQPHQQDARPTPTPTATLTADFDFFSGGVGDV